MGLSQVDNYILIYWLTYDYTSFKSALTYALAGREDGGDCRIFEVSDPPPDIEAVFGEVRTAEILVTAGGPFVSPHVVDPPLQSGLILQRKPTTELNM